MIDHCGNVEVSRSKALAEIEFYHPKANSLPTPLLQKLVDAFNNISRDTGVTAIIFKSRGEGTFCAGASFEEFRRIGSVVEAKEFFHGFAQLLLAIIRCPQFVITCVQGKAVGGGVGLIAASDYVFALDSAAVKLSELQLGIGPFTIGPLVERKLGAAHFSAMTIDASWRDSSWCLANGLFTRVFEEPKQMEEEVEKLIESFSSVSPKAIVANKKAIWRGTDDLQALLKERAEICGKLLIASKVVD